MEKKAKGYKGRTWVQYLLEHKEKRGISFRDLARECDMSDASWHALVTGKGPPNHKRAEQVIGSLRMDKEIWLNTIFKDRFLRWAKLEGILTKPPTPAIEKILDYIISWDTTSEEEDPASKRGAPIRYIMSTSSETLGMGIASNFRHLRPELIHKCQEKRNGIVRGVDFQ